MKFLDNVGDPSYFPIPLLGCLHHVSFSRYSPLSLEVVQNQTNIKVFAPNIFLEQRPQFFYGILIERFNVRRLAKFG